MSFNQPLVGQGFDPAAGLPPGAERPKYRRVGILAVVCIIAASDTANSTPKPPKDSLASLIQAGNHKEALARIRAGADVNEPQPDGTRPIHWAVYHVDYELLGALIAKKAKVNVTNEFGSTPIAEAAGLGDARMVKMLLDAGAEPEGANQDGQTALMLAIKRGELPVVEMLIKAGANVNAVEKFHNQTPLMWAAAAQKNAGEMVKLLLSKGADVKPRALYSDWPSQITSEPRAQYRPVGGLTALLYAARDGCYDCVEALIAAGADVNVPTPEGVTPLMLALDNEHNDVAKLLLDRGANPHVWDWWGRTALYIVIDRRESATAPARGGRGGGSSRSGGGGEAPAAAGASRRPQVSTLDIVNMLLAADVDPNTELNMHRPSRGGNSGYLIRRPAFEHTGCTPLLRATMGNDLEVVKALLAKGALPNINDMEFPRHSSWRSELVRNRHCRGGGGGGAAGGSGTANMALMDVLLEHGADVKCWAGHRHEDDTPCGSPTTPSGQRRRKSALHEAVQAGRTDLVRYLLDKGANPELVDANGHKPIDLVGSLATGNAGRGAAVPAAPTGARAVTGGGGNAANAVEIRAILQNVRPRK